ncbi:hypothetical protein RUND412_004315 [Rhizina undulata]
MAIGLEQALETVKALYVRGQWRRCTSQCEDFISALSASPNTHPIHLSTLHFYHAASLEETLRHTRDISAQSEQLPRIRASYTSALSCLPQVPGFYENAEEEEKKKRLDASIVDVKLLIQEKLAKIEDMINNGGCDPDKVTKGSNAHNRKYVRRELP